MFICGQFSASWLKSLEINTTSFEKIVKINCGTTFSLGLIFLKTWADFKNYKHNIKFSIKVHAKYSRDVA